MARENRDVRRRGKDTPRGQAEVVCLHISTQGFIEVAGKSVWGCKACGRQTL